MPPTQAHRRKVRRAFSIGSALVRLQKDLDTTVLRCKRIAWNLKTLVGKTADLAHTIFRKPTANQHVIGALRARRGKTPVVVSAVLEGTTIRMATDGNRTGARGQKLADLLHSNDHCLF